MGADIGDETAAIEEIRALSQEARGYISHHLRNTLMNITCAITMGEYDLANEAIMHAVEDLKRIGC